MIPTLLGKSGPEGPSTEEDGERERSYIGVRVREAAADGIFGA